MSLHALALLGGRPIIGNELALFQAIGEDDIAAVTEVMRTGVLSAYIGAAGSAFMGGPQVRQFEADAAAYFGVRHAIAVNS